MPGLGGWKEWTPQVPMPRRPTQASPRIFERLVLEARLRDADHGAIPQERRPIRRHQMRHLTAFPHMTVQPEAAVHRVNHPFPSGAELPVGCCLSPLTLPPGHVSSDPVGAAIGAESRRGPVPTGRSERPRPYR
jgi:hypothetical protein